MRAQWSSETNIRLMRDSIKRCEEFATRMRINVWFRQGGYLFLARSERIAKTLESSVALQREPRREPSVDRYRRFRRPTRLDQLHHRHLRAFPQPLQILHLKRLNEYYNKWIDGYKEGQLLIIDVDKNKFAEKEEDLGEIITKVDAQLYGLF